MPFALVIIGLLMVVTGARDTHVNFARELRADFTGPPNQNFIYWLIAIGLVGSMGYIKPLAPLSKAFLVLVIIAMILAQSRDGSGGFFAKLQQAIAQGPEPQTQYGVTSKGEPYATAPIPGAPKSQSSAAPTPESVAKNTTATWQNLFSSITRFIIPTVPGM